MPTICICVEPLFEGASLAEKAERVAQAGFKAIEFWFYDEGPGERNIDELAAACRNRGLIVNDLVVSSADGKIGGAMVNPADRRTYLARLRESIAVAKKLDCKKFISCTGNAVEGLTHEEQHKSAVETLKAGAPIAAQEGITLMLEPLNSPVDHPGYYLDNGHEGAKIVQEVNHPAVRLLWDIYHMQIMHGNVLDNIKQYLPLIAHFHAAGVPGRHELDNGELNYLEILKRIKEMGYQGCCGLEYWPIGPDHAASLARMRELTRAAGWD